ncbi:CLUMA_CG007306, isoform A [Clunio marinus]|uniref:CLUMA_CG007306, isoform A n=1 Tax=Clunio marinus TaxID=568069 RepID=A0A1J1I1Z2_9DIPT|nr:CLUMA_CG007306, isoform A [Clunio marinus]
MIQMLKSFQGKAFFKFSFSVILLFDKTVETFYFLLQIKKQ